VSRSVQAPSVLVIGAGMYVCGRGTDDIGTVLPTLVQAQAEGDIGEISVAATSQGSVRALREKLAEINRRLEMSAMVRTYPDHGDDPNAYRAALADMSRPACAIVVVPDHLHTKMALEVIDAGLHVLVVKPLTTTLTDADKLIGRAHAKGVYGAVEFHKRWDEANLLLRQAIADGRLGELRHISVEYGQRKTIQDTFASWRRHTNIFQYLGVHYADLIYFLTGVTPVRVSALGVPKGMTRQEAWKFDAIQALIEWKSGKMAFVSSILTTWLEPNRASAMSDQRIRVLGTLGRYDSDQKHRGVQVVTDAGVEDVNPYFSQLYRGSNERMGIEGYGPRSIQQFLQDVCALNGGRVQLSELTWTRPTFQDALASTVIVEAVNESLSQGGAWVEIEPGCFEREDAPARVGAARARQRRMTANAR